MIALLASPAGRWLIGALAAVLVIVGVYVYAHHGGYVQAQTHYQGQIAQLKADIATERANEIERQDTANNAAKSREAAAIAQMQADNDTLQNKIEELQREADKDPDADKPALGSSSVRRINEVR